MKNLKVIAFYLPQFHSFPENDKWWGKGFTEWVNVKKSKPQFKGHIQPEVPLDHNYYNLMDPSVQVRQAEMAEKYGIYGFCYYHYWFDGKMLMQKPMENMLNNPDIHLPFCVCWANETWSRRWNGQEKDILMAQNYNEGKEGWKKHFDYLLPFFKDERYIKHGNKPMMIIYRPHFIKKLRAMLSYWNSLARENGFDGMYFGFQHYDEYQYDVMDKGFDFGIEFEPFFTVFEKYTHNQYTYALKHPGFLMHKLREKILKLPSCYDYDEIWKSILKRKPLPGRVPGAFTGWDNTPRRGNKAAVFVHSSPKKFAYYFKKQVDHAINDYKSEYLFIDAWNEWAEGAHLEPDEYNGYGYLKAVRRALKDDTDA